MKKSSQLIFLFFFVFTLTSCIHNSGPDNDLYGRWVLDHIEAENTDAPQQAGDIFFAFQSDVVQLQRFNSGHYYSEAYGSFSFNGDSLSLHFSGSSDRFSPFPQTGLPLDADLKVLKLSGHQLILKYSPSPQSSLTYYFRKW